MNALTQFLSGSNFVSANRAEEIASFFKEKRILRNELFLKAGHISDEYLFLQEGFLRAFTLDPDGNDVTTGFITKNKIAFEVSSFFNRTPSKETIVALTDGHGYYINYDQLQVLFHSIAEFREFGRSILVKGYVSLKDRMLSLINETAEQRYSKLINENPEVFQHASLKSIASYLGITDTSLSRIRKQYSLPR